MSGNNGDVVLGMDATYWGRGFGVMLFRDITMRKNLYWKIITHETVADYIQGIKLLQSKNWNIVAVVCDGKSGLINALANIPVQLCQYHQYKTVIKYITKKPQLMASVELKRIVDIMCQTDKESFCGILQEWEQKWKDFINEKTYNSTNKRKWQYTHKKLRSAFNSLKRYQNNLFVWYDNPELNIPNTNNALEGTFSNLKQKLSVHNGLKKSRKIKLINYLLGK